MKSFRSIVMLDDGGVARAAGEMFDEPALARPITGDALNGLLPERFFQLQDDLRARIRQVVMAAAQRDRARLSDVRQRARAGSPGQLAGVRVLAETG